MSEKKLTSEQRSTIVVLDDGQRIRLGVLFKQQINAFNEWWHKNVYLELKKNKRILYDNNAKCQTRIKFIAFMDTNEYIELVEAYSSIKHKLSLAIPEEYRQYFFLDKNFKFINTNSCTLKISSAYTTVTKKITVERIKDFLMSIIENMSDRKLYEEYKTEIYELISQLDSKKTYRIKQITANKYQFNYYDIGLNQSFHTNVGHALFVPLGTKLSEPKQTKTRSDTLFANGIIYINKRIYYFFENE